MHKLLGDGEVIDAEFEDSQDSALRLELEKVKAERNAYRQELEALKHSIVNLRKSLSPLYASLKGLFGEMDKFHVSDSPTASVGGNEKWDKLKVKLGGKMAQIIEALQLTGTATRTQLRNQTGGALGTIDQAVYKLRDMGLLVKNGDGWSLKP